MNERPPFATLRLTEPRMTHPSVVWLQELVNRSPYVRPALLVDGTFGPHTAQEVGAALYRLGAPEPRNAIGPETMAVLWEWDQTGVLPTLWRARRLDRMAQGFKADMGITLRSWAGLHPVASGGDGVLTIIPRERVGLRPPGNRTGSIQLSTDGAVVHWQGPGRGALGLEAACAQLRGFQAYHMDTHGWSDIGYHFAIPRGCPVGTVLEGRGFGVRGAHSGHNVANARLGILVMFGDQDREPTPDQLATLELFLNEHARGYLTGHQEWSPTSCPGTALMAWVKANR